MWPVGESLSYLQADLFLCLDMYLGSSSFHLGREQSKEKWAIFRKFIFCRVEVIALMNLIK